MAALARWRAGPAVRAMAAAVRPCPQSALTLPRVMDPPVSVAASLIAPAQLALTRTAPARMAQLRPALPPLVLSPLALTGAAAARPDGIFPARAVPADGAESQFTVVPDSPARALAYLSGALDFLAHANPAEWPAGQQADCLRALAVAESRQAAAHARILRAFSVPGGGLAGDGHRSPRVWLTWQCAATRRAAAYRVSWMHRLDGHPLIAAALADGTSRCRGRRR